MWTRIIDNFTAPYIESIDSYISALISLESLLPTEEVVFESELFADYTVASPHEKFDQTLSQLDQALLEWKSKIFNQVNGYINQLYGAHPERGKLLKVEINALTANANDQRMMVDNKGLDPETRSNYESLYSDTRNRLDDVKQQILRGRTSFVVALPHYTKVLESSLKLSEAIVTLDHLFANYEELEKQELTPEEYQGSINQLIQKLDENGSVTAIGLQSNLQARNSLSEIFEMRVTPETPTQSVKLTDLLQIKKVLEHTSAQMLKMHGIILHMKRFAGMDVDLTSNDVCSLLSSAFFLSQFLEKYTSVIKLYMELQMTLVQAAL